MDPPARYWSYGDLKDALKERRQRISDPTTKKPLDRQQLLQKALQLGILSEADAAVPDGKYYQLKELTQLLGHGSSNKNKASRQQLLQQCLERGLITDRMLMPSRPGRGLPLWALPQRPSCGHMPQQYV
jgi:hypothetical protein